MSQRRKRRFRFAVLPAGLWLLAVVAAGEAAAGGFFVSAEGDFLSADHVVRRCPAPYVETEDGRLPLERVAASRTLDVALLRAERRSPAFARFPMRPSQSLRGPLTMVRRDGGELRIVRARFAGYAQKLGEKLVVKADRPIIVGDSGSPLVDARGSLVGMMVAKALKEESIGIAVDTFTLVDFLAEAGVPIETVDPVGNDGGGTDGGGATGTPGDAGDGKGKSPQSIASRFTYRIGCLAALEDAIGAKPGASAE